MSYLAELRAHILDCLLKTEFPPTERSDIKIVVNSIALYFEKFKYFQKTIEKIVKTRYNNLGVRSHANGIELWREKVLANKHFCFLVK